MIDLSSRRLDDEALIQRLQSVENIVSLNLQNNRITVQGVNAVLLNCSFRHDLESLNLSNNQITYEIFNLLIAFPCPTLKYLDLSQNSFPQNISETTLYKRFKALYGQVQLKMNGYQTSEIQNLVYNPQNISINTDLMCKLCKEMFIDKLTYIQQVTGQQQEQNTNLNPQIKQAQNNMKVSDISNTFDDEIFNLDDNSEDISYHNLQEDSLKHNKDNQYKSSYTTPDNMKQFQKQEKDDDLKQDIHQNNPINSFTLIEHLKKKKEQLQKTLQKRQLELQRVRQNKNQIKSNQQLQSEQLDKLKEFNTKLTQSYNNMQIIPFVSSKIQLNIQKIKISDLQFQIDSKLTPLNNQKSVANLTNYYNSIIIPSNNDVSGIVSCFNKLLANQRDMEVSLYHLIKEKDQLINQDQQYITQQQQRISNILENSKANFDKSALKFQKDSQRLINDQIEASQINKLSQIKHIENDSEKSSSSKQSSFIQKETNNNDHKDLPVNSITFQQNNEIIKQQEQQHKNNEDSNSQTDINEHEDTIQEQDETEQLQQKPKIEEQLEHEQQCIDEPEHELLHYPQYNSAIKNMPISKGPLLKQEELYSQSNQQSKTDQECEQQTSRDERQSSKSQDSTSQSNQREEKEEQNEEDQQTDYSAQQSLSLSSHSTYTSIKSAKQEKQKDEMQKEDSNIGQRQSEQINKQDIFKAKSNNIDAEEIKKDFPKQKEIIDSSKSEDNLGFPKKSATEESQKKQEKETQNNNEQQNNQFYEKLKQKLQQRSELKQQNQNDNFESKPHNSTFTDLNTSNGLSLSQISSKRSRVQDSTFPQPKPQMNKRTKLTKIIKEYQIMH